MPSYGIEAGARAPGAVSLIEGDILATAEDTIPARPKDEVDSTARCAIARLCEKRRADGERQNLTTYVPTYTSIAKVAPPTTFGCPHI